MKQSLFYFFTVFFRSYSQLFFESNITYGILIFLLTLTSPYLALNAALAITASIFVAPVFKFNSKLMSSGEFGVNPFLSGGAIYLFYHNNFILAFFSGAIAMFFTMVITNLFRAYKLPFLSFPFILTSFLLLVLFKPELGSIPIIETDFKSNFILTYFTIISHCFSAMCFLTYWWQGLVLAVLLVIFNVKSFINVVVAVSVVAFVLIFFNYGNHLISFYFYGFNFVLVALAVQHLISSNYIYTLILIPILTSFSLVLLFFLHPMFNNLSLSALSIPFSIIVLLAKIIQNKNSIQKIVWKKE
jgi:urea transporter